MSARTRGVRNFLVTRFSATLIAVTILGLGPKEWWICDLLSHVRVHALIAFFFLIPLQVHWGRRSLVVVSSIVAMINLLFFLPQFQQPDFLLSATDQELSIISYNLGPRQEGGDKTVAYLSNSSADLIILQEYTPYWQQTLSALTDQYPYSVVEIRDDAFGIALFGRVPLKDSSVEYVSNSSIPLIFTTVETSDNSILFAGVHLQWPALPALVAERNLQVQKIMSIASNDGRTTVACGDWNLTPWSGWYTALMSAGFRDGNATLKISATWPAQLGWFGIPIDHCLVAGKVKISEKQIGPQLESDHRPILVTVRVASGNNTSEEVSNR